MGALSNMIAVTERHCCVRDFDTQLERVCRERPLRLILREKDLDDDAYETLLITALKHCRTYGIPLSVNGRPHIAQKYGTDIHLSYSGFLNFLKNCPPAADINAIGVSVHSAAEAADAALLGADYIIAGHIFATDCKKGVPPRGLDFLKDVCAAVSDVSRTNGHPPTPVYGIGGIKKSRLPLLLDAGAAGGCMMSAAMRL